jgi:hypothetical protein
MEKQKLLAKLVSPTHFDHLCLKLTASLWHCPVQYITLAFVIAQLGGSAVLVHLCGAGAAATRRSRAGG